MSILEFEQWKILTCSKFIHGNFVRAKINCSCIHYTYGEEFKENVDERDKFIYGSELDYRINEFKVGSI